MMEVEEEEVASRSHLRYDMGPVLEWFGSKVTILEIARKTNIDSRQLHRWMRVGITFWGADELATRLNLLPGDLWPEWDRDEPSSVIVDWTERRRVEAERRREEERAHRAAIRATLPAPDIADIRPPGDFRFPPRPPMRPVGEAPPRAGISADLVFIFPEWLAKSPNPPDSPPRKEEASCACSTLDEYGRPPIGRCGSNCERRLA